MDARGKEKLRDAKSGNEGGDVESRSREGKGEGK